MLCKYGESLTSLENRFHNLAVYPGELEVMPHGLVPPAYCDIVKIPVLERSDQAIRLVSDEAHCCIGWKVIDSMQHLQSPSFW